MEMLVLSFRRLVLGSFSLEIGLDLGSRRCLLSFSPSSLCRTFDGGGQQWDLVYVSCALASVSLMVVVGFRIFNPSDRGLGAGYVVIRQSFKGTSSVMKLLCFGLDANFNLIKASTETSVSSSRQPMGHLISGFKISSLNRSSLARFGSGPYALVSPYLYMNGAQEIDWDEVCYHSFKTNKALGLSSYQLSLDQSSLGYRLFH
ncbi:unnamed protein product [Arabis nemorensis]|uniref:Uncharacterized protein n=1 Tax=Arabis nemorensis TaxID=586526 RepID=A0A565BL86_9BRAS|nr:unnamed protein product [Arabis nemorensis]